MGNPSELDTAPRRGRRGVLVGVLVLAGSLFAGTTAWLDAQVPAVAALDVASLSPALPASILDGQAGLVTQRLSAASGRTLESVAEGAPGVAVNPLESDAPIVAGAQAASSEYAETLARLSEAEQAAAEQLALSEQEAAQAEAERRAASEALADEEAAAAREIDAAIAAAIAAASAESAYTGPVGGTFDPGSGSSAGLPSGRPTTTEEVLGLVRRYFPASEVGNAMAVSRCESGHRNVIGAPNTNGTRDFGIFQINDGGTLQASLRGIGVSYSSLFDAQAKALDPELNVRMARAIWDNRGWQPWVCAAKMKVVAGLYQRTPGPMYGQYDEYGRAL